MRGIRGQGSVECCGSSTAGTCRGQGSTEYLVLLALAIIIVLVAISLLSYLPSTTSDVSETQSKVYWSNAKPIAIGDAQSTYDNEVGKGGYLLTVQNTELEPLTLSGVKIDGTAKSFRARNSTMNSSVIIGGGGSSSVYVYTTDSGVPCAEGQQESMNVTFNYWSSYGTALSEKGSKKLLVRCSTPPPDGGGYTCSVTNPFGTCPEGENCCQSTCPASAHCTASPCPGIPNFCCDEARPNCNEYDTCCNDGFTCQGGTCQGTIACGSETCSSNQECCITSCPYKTYCADKIGGRSACPAFSNRCCNEGESCNKEDGCCGGFTCQSGTCQAPACGGQTSGTCPEGQTCQLASLCPGTYVCSEITLPIDNVCCELGGECNGADTCCKHGAVCTNNVCCLGDGIECGDSSECCRGFACSHGACTCASEGQGCDQMNIDAVPCCPGLRCNSSRGLCVPA